MKKYLWIIIVNKLVVLSMFSWCSVAQSEELPFYQDGSFTPTWLSNNDPTLATLHKIPPFSFTDQSGETVTDKDFEHKIYVAGFFFSTCPGICPTVRSKLNKVQERFKHDEQVKIVQHSIRPSTDTVDVLQAYAKKNGIDNSHWYLLTGDKTTLYTLAKGAYFASEDLGNVQKNKDFLHTESLLLIDQNKHIRGIYNGLNSTSVDYLLNDIETLKKSLNDMAN